MSKSEPKKAVYTWNDIDRLTRQLGDCLNADNFVPDIIIGILRGGVIPAVHLSHLLDVREFGTLHFQTTTSDEVSATRIDPKLLTEPQLGNIEGRNILLVDDVVNTGATMRTAQNLIRTCQPRRLYSVALVWDRLSLDGGQIQKADCDMWADEVTAWVIFPWNE